MLRRLLVMVVAMTIVAGAGVAVAATGHRTRLNCMDTVWSTTVVSTSSTTFTNVPGFTDQPVSIYPIAVSVSASVSGAPVLFRIQSTNVGAQTRVSAPGRVRFAPPTGGGAFSYQWIERDGSAATHAIDLRLQWRSPSGQPVTLQRGDLSAIYETDAGACAG